MNPADRRFPGSPDHLISGSPDHLISGSPDIPSLYLHIPFCRKKCNYCDFVSYAGKEGLMGEYVNALCQEISGLATRNPRPATVYFGGGTPTLLEPKHFEKLFGLLIMIIIINKEIELSIESNPGTADKSKLKSLRRLGINRLSIGVQSFNDKHLKTLGRIHTADEAISFYDNARSAGFENINLDLMFALPGQTLDEWKADLDFAVGLQPDHLSTYNLQIEEGTPLSLWERGTGGEGFLAIPSEETELAMYEYAIDTLTSAGYKHYEISNFAKPGYECLHNINYWKNGNYFGAGAGAHSHVNGKRWSNPDSIEEYIHSVTVTQPVSVTSAGIRPSPSPIDDTGLVADKRETIFMGLRLLDGLETEKFAGFEKETAELMNDGLLELKDNRYRLTRRGLFLGNLVFEKFV